MARHTAVLAALVLALVATAHATSYTSRPYPGLRRRTRCYRSPAGRATACPGHTVCLLRRVRRSGWAKGRCARLGLTPSCSHFLCRARGRRAACAAGGVYFTCKAWERLRRHRARCRVAPNGITSRCPGSTRCVLDKVRKDGWGRGECMRIGWTPGCGRWWCAARGRNATCRAGERYFTCRVFAKIQRRAARGVRRQRFLAQFRGGQCFASPAGASTRCRGGAVCVLARARRDGWARGMCENVLRSVRCTKRHCGVTGARTACVDGGRHWSCRAWVHARSLQWKSLGAPPKAVVPAPGPSAGSCSTSPIRGAPTGRPCPAGQTCVVTDFGIPIVDRPNVGRCQALVRSAPVCTLDLCGGRGASTPCSPIDTPIVSTCGAWAARADGGARPECRVACTSDCALGTPAAPADSNGKRYCNPCVLRAASCNARFAFFGPVGPGVGGAPPSPGAPGLPSTPSGGCSTSPSQIVGAPAPGPACPAGQLCVIKDFGLPAADRPNRGVCQTASNPPRCTFDLCGGRGSDTVCTTPDNGDATTCGAWASRSDGGARPDCGRFCTADCALGMPSAPADSNGKRYCNSCVLRVAACNAGFSFFGPVAPTNPGPALAPPTQVRTRSVPPVVTTAPTQRATHCSFDFCTARGAAASCATPDTKRASTCGDWAARTDGGVRPSCARFCTADCKLGQPDAPSDSRGKRYCNACVLRIASCAAGFAFFGPVAPSTPRAPAPAPPAPVAPVATPPPERVPPAATPPPARLPNTCTFMLCTAGGARTRCATPDTKKATTCGGWATRTDGGEKPDCGLICIQSCNGGIKDNNGKEYCNACILRVQSCVANFEFFGPILN